MCISAYRCTMLNTLGRKIMHDVSMGKFISWSFYLTMLASHWVPFTDLAILLLCRKHCSGSGW
ncbi:uncharacterized protein BDW43DRAFT_104501 [Aspergillus alliaceus]|uniref:uncharacterized protein n=1 Tax=Petromyces alliaceus TaxID=209559 RepID=UPI0012A63EC7|nr:uncharacterized protein BDW43DRAFT_104501 [Aspergillus alliaceus]KAB8232813.1 hypothetical protein BDW43DRAFT_104501 [Aspergillus alliaceus]